MRNPSVVTAWVLGLALALPALAVERVEVPGASADIAQGSPDTGQFRLKFRTFVPRAKAGSIVGTILVDEQASGLIHRILIDPKRGLYYGYDVRLSKAAAADQIVVAVQPLDSVVESRFREVLWNDYCKDCGTPRPVASVRQQYPQPQVVSLGDTLTLDLLADDRSGELISEHITSVAFRDPTRRMQVFPALDLKAEFVNLQMAKSQLFVNGRSALKEEMNPSASVQGPVVWAEFPGRGRFFLSLARQAGYDFKKIGVVSENKVSFVIDGDRYEWVSSGPIATPGPVPPFGNAQSWNVWVLYDRDFASSGDCQCAMGAGLDTRARLRLKQP
jgi:hypothetical protein